MAPVAQPAGRGIESGCSGALREETKPLEGPVGFEPTTPGLKVRKSTGRPPGPNSDSNSADLTAGTD